MAEVDREPHWRRRIGTAPKTWVALMAAGATLGWLPFVARPLSPDEAGYLMVGAQWGEGTSLYGDYWVDRPPVLVALFEAADALGGTVPLRLLGATAVLVTVLLAGAVGRLAAPERRSAPLLTAGAAAAATATPLFGGSVVNGELLGLPFLLAGIAALLAAVTTPDRGRALAWSLAAGAAGAIAVLVKQSLVDVFVLAGVLAVTSAAVRRRLPGLLAGSVATAACVVVLAWLRGTGPTGLWSAVVTFRLEASRELAVASGGSPDRLVGMLGALWGSGFPLLVAALAWKGRGRPSAQGPATAPDLRVAAYVVLGLEVAVAVLGGSYWLHYLMALTPGLVLCAAAFAQRPAPVTREIGGAFALAGVSAVAVIGWVGLHPIERPEARAISYLDEHAEPGDDAVVVLGGANVLRDSGLTSPYPYLWSLPARVRDRDLTELDRVVGATPPPTWVLVAHRSLGHWELDFTSVQAELDIGYERVSKAGKFTIYRSLDR